jgi:hypothetical protein
MDNRSRAVMFPRLRVSVDRGERGCEGRDAWLRFAGYQSNLHRRHGQFLAVNIALTQRTAGVLNGAVAMDRIFGSDGTRET